jgi:hypothetical protein
MEEKNILYIDLTPKPLWNNKAISDFDSIKKKLLEKHDKCEICEETKNLNVSIRWKYDDEKHIQKFIKFIVMCELCNFASHLGYASIVGKRIDAEQHLKKIRNWDDDTLDDNIDDAFYIWNVRSKYNWTTDISLKQN